HQLAHSQRHCYAHTFDAPSRSHRSPGYYLDTLWHGLCPLRKTVSPTNYSSPSLATFAHRRALVASADYLDTVTKQRSGVARSTSTSAARRQSGDREIEIGVVSI